MTDRLNRPTRRQFGALAGIGATGAALGGAALASGSPAYRLPVNLSKLVPGNAQQVVLTVASGYRNPRATVSGWARQPDGTWLLAQGPFASWIGAGGFAASGHKREGDAHSPTGVFSIPLAFGTQPKPAGVRLPFHLLKPPYEIWVENPRSRYYNELVDIRRVGARAIGDRESPVTYPLGAFVAYNSRRVPGMGSAIFFHPSHNSPTIGCVSIPLTQLRSMISWLSPTAAPGDGDGRDRRTAHDGRASPGHHPRAVTDTDRHHVTGGHPDPDRFPDRFADPGADGLFDTEPVADLVPADGHAGRLTPARESSCPLFVTRQCGCIRPGSGPRSPGSACSPASS